MKTTYKVGDWVFCEFKLQQIEQVEDGRIVDVSDGYFSHGAYSLNDRCFPITLQNKMLSEYVASCSDRLHKEGNNSLNYPDIHNWLVNRWVDLCKTVVEDVSQKLRKDIGVFTNTILNRCKELREETYEGVKIFRT